MVQLVEIIMLRIMKERFFIVKLLIYCKLLKVQKDAHNTDEFFVNFIVISFKPSQRPLEFRISLHFPQMGEWCTHQLLLVQ